MADSSLSKVVDGVTIYLGIVPAEIMRGHPTEHPQGTMHGGVPREREQYHVMVALFDAKTGQRITDADVKASVAALGRTGSPVTLEPMNIADTITATTSICRAMGYSASINRSEDPIQRT